jgi:hypothetical protein
LQQQQQVVLQGAAQWLLLFSGGAAAAAPVLEGYDCSGVYRGSQCLFLVGSMGLLALPAAAVAASLSL